MALTASSDNPASRPKFSNLIGGTAQATGCVSHRSRPRQTRRRLRAAAQRRCLKLIVNIKSDAMRASASANVNYCGAKAGCSAARRTYRIMSVNTQRCAGAAWIKREPLLDFCRCAQITSNPTTWIVPTPTYFGRSGVPMMMGCCKKSAGSDTAAEACDPQALVRQLQRCVRMLSSVSTLLPRAVDVSDLLTRTCDMAIRVGGYRAAAAALYHDPHGRSLTCVASRAINPGLAARLANEIVLAGARS